MTLVVLLLFGCNVAKTDEEGNEISEKDLKATSSAKEQKTLSLNIDKEQLKKEAKSKLLYWFEKFEIKNWWNNKVEDLSKGMAQKIQFITTIIHEPKLLILDEPFSGFDPINTDLVKKEIHELKEKGTSIILSTHNMNSVEEICDHIALINKSNKILEGKVEAIKEQYSEGLYNITFKGNVVSFANSVWGGWTLIHQEQLKEDVFKSTIQLGSQLKLNDFIKGIIGSIEIVEIQKVIPSMNDIFIKAIKEANQPETFNRQ